MFSNTLSPEEIRGQLAEFTLSDLMRAYQASVKRGDLKTAGFIKRQRAAGDLLTGLPIAAHMLDEFMKRIDAEAAK